MMGDLLYFPQRPTEPRLSKAQFARVHGRSTRWVELRVAEGMPSFLVDGRRMFLLSETRPWFAEREAQSA